jgi:arylsulfatase A-like enzyme
MKSACRFNSRTESAQFLPLIFRSPFSCQLALRTCAILFLVSCSFASAAEQPPNVVFIFADDLGYGDLTCYGATKVSTPNIDSLARDGRKFTDAHTASAVCTPSRYALLTGEYPIRANGGKGTWGPLSSLSHLIIDTETLTIGKVFKNKGYETAAIGKWHLGFGKGKNDWSVPLKPGPNDVGFDYYFGVPLVNSGSPFVYVENDTIVGYDPKDPLVFGKKPPSPTPRFPPEASTKSVNRFGGALKAHQIYDDEKTGELLTEKATNWITTNKDKPFFLYFPTTNIHHPFTPAPRFKGTSQCGLYGDYIHELDWMVGELLACLEENGLSDNTLVIFTSDNGGMLNRGGRDAMKAGHKMNGELLGFKFGAWEGGHRVPFIARWPGKVEAGTQSDQLICSVDMLATFMALTGQSVETLENKDSINVLPSLLSNPDKPLRTELLLAPRHSRNVAIRKDNWMYIGARGSGGFTGSKPNDHAWGGPPAAAFAGSVNSDIHNGKLKPGAPPAQLYDLKSDLSQTKNLYRQNPEIVKQMEKLLDSYLPKKARFTEKSKKGARRKGGKKPAVKAAEKGKATERVKTPERVKATERSALPNVIVMLTDDLGYSDVGCYGAQRVKTPHIDQLAAEGVRFTDFHTAASICSPSRAAFLTGAYPQRAGLYMGINPHRTAHWFLGLHPNEITIAEQFQQQGYATHMVGKWHLGTEPEFLPRKQGFDHYYGMPCNFAHSPKFFDDDKEVFAKTPLDRLTALYTQRVTSLIGDQAKSGEPFFLYYAHNYPHTPFQAGKEFKGTSQDGVRGDVMQELDWSVGQMMTALKEAGVADNTLVIFTSDNGPTHNKYAKPYRGTKYVTLEGGHRVPFIFHWPALIKEASVSSVSVNAMDLFPTLSEIIAADLPTDRVYDGESLLPLFAGKPLKRTASDPFYFYNCENLQAVRSGDWKLHLPRKPEQLPFWEKNKAFANLQNPVLYNLRSDQAETTDVAADNPEIVREMLNVAQSARKDLGEFMQRGKSQRATGSIFPDGPVISHEKDWGTVSADTAKAIATERQKRHPTRRAGNPKR